VILVAVDEAVLRLTGFRLPDPFWSLFRTPASSVVADDLRRHLARLGIDVEHQDWAALRGRGGGGMGGFGSGGGGGGIGMGGRGTAGPSGSKQEQPRRNFLTTAWQGSVVTGPDGKAEVSFTLPDNLTQYRLMAMAVDAERSSGTGWAQFRVDQPLLALPAVPRVVRLGDRFEAGVVLYQSGAGVQAQVTATVAGDAVRLEGPATRALTLQQAKEQEVRFGFVASRPGAVKLTFGVKAGGLSDLVEHPLEVTDPALLEASAVSGETTTAVRQGIAPLSSLRPDRGGLEVSLSSTALTGVEDGLEQLIDYPYGCLEQTGSRILGLTVATVLGDRFGLKLPREPKVLLRRGVDRLLSLQRGDGGFGFWPGSTIGSVWGTAYALTVLHRVRLAEPAHGVVVPPEVVKRATRWLERERGRYARTGTVGWQTWYWSYHTAILYALALSGVDVQKEALAAAEDRLHQPLFARAVLLAALKAGKRSAPVEAVIAELTRELGDSLRIEGQTAHAEENLSDGYQVLMHSSDRTTAMVLLALVESPTKHPMVPRIVRWLMHGRKQARFRNTQEAAWALMAAWDYARHWEKDVPDFEAGVWVGRGRVLTSFFRGREVKPQQSTTPMATLVKIAGATASDLVIGKRGTGTLYYVARLRYARRQLPTRGRDHGFAVKRSVEVLDGAGRPLKAQRPARLGDTVLVTLEVTSPEARQYVVIDDPLPAGMEGLDATLSTGSRSFGEAMGWKGTDWYDHREMRDDRVLFFRDLKQPGTLTYRYLARVTAPGTFTRPPTKAEQMYEPEVFGHTAAEKITFLAR
jgi:hypothetical protein